MTHVFALGHLMGRPGCGPLVDHGLARPDGTLPRPRPRGLVRRRRRRRADRAGQERLPARVRRARRRQRDLRRPPRCGASCWSEALDVLLTRFWDDEHGMVVEEWDESFSTLDTYRGVNANMHTVEALLAAADATGDRGPAGPGAADRDPGGARPRARPPLAAAGALRRAVDPAAGLQPRHARPTRSAPTARRSGTGWSGPGWPCTCGPRSAPRPRTGCSTTRSGCSRPRSARAGRSTARTGSSTPWTGTASPWCGSGCTGSRPRPRPPPPRCTRRPATRRTTTGTRPGGTTSPRCSSTASWGRGATSSTPQNRPSGTVWKGKPDTYHAFQATLIPRLPLTPTLAAALRDGLLG